VHVAAQRARGVRKRRLVAVPERDAGAARKEPLCDGVSDAGGAAGDDGAAAGEVETIHGCVSSGVGATPMA
jgi:hypothetical protein